LKQKIVSLVVIFLLLVSSISIVLVNSAAVSAASPTITLNLTSGPAGAVVTVLGSGFSSNETGINITFDSVPVTTGIVANAAGTWSSSFTVPTAIYGNHSVGAFGSVTAAASVPLISFFVLTPNVTITQNTGTAGTQVSVSGSGFAPGETGITVTFDDNPIIHGIVANSLGNWSGIFTVPLTTSGYHVISAYGTITQAGFVPSLTFLVVNPSVTVSPTNGTPGTLVTVSGSGFGAGETGITMTFDSTPVGFLVTASLQGTWSGTFTVPAAAGGGHVITAYGAATSANNVASVTFIVTPIITSSQTNGPPGTSVTVNGYGFGANESGITVTYDTLSAASGITASSQGSWKATFTVPSSAAGSHALAAFGASTRASSITTVYFTVNPAIAISQTNGSPGATISVNGNGFGSNETGITITYDGSAVASGITADSQGSWKGTFDVPSSASGSHTVSAFGSATPSGTVTGVIFSLNSSIAISQASGTTGTLITVTGSGFGSNETGITITYDNNPVTSGIAANSLGNWSGTFTIPASASGSHKVAAYGLSTQASRVAGANFKVTPIISVSPTPGYVGKPVVVSGSGFIANSALLVTYDNQDISTAGITTDATGSFNVSFNAPASVGGNHTINVADVQKNSAKATFTMDSTPPPVPTPLSPKDGSSAGFLGGATPTFTWSNVTDPSGVSYTLEVDTSPDFSNPVVEKTGLTANRYTLTSAESLPYGKYYWRVQATDGASNASAWSAVLLVKSGVMKAWLFILIVLIIVAGIGAGVYFLIRRRPSKAGPVVVTGIEAPQTVQGEWRMVESEPTSEQSQLPWRLALPEPTKKGKTISTEDQARLKVIIDFAQSLPLVEPDFNTDWIFDLIEADIGAQMSAPVYEKLFQGELGVSYDPAWLRHPAYQDLTTLLQKQAILQDLNTFVGDTNHCVAEAISMLQQIYLEAKPELPADLLERGGWWFITAVYTDAVSWFAGKSLREPSERDYSVKPASWPGADMTERWLCGEDPTPFSGELVLINDDAEASKLRTIHIRLRRSWRSNDKARQVAAMITRIQLQQSRLLSTFSQFDRLKL
jgi:hypothetical protein